MLSEERNSFKEPFLINIWAEGKYRTLNVNPFTYDSESGCVMLLDLETKECFKGLVFGRTIKVLSKIEVIRYKSYEEFIFSAYNKNNNKNLFNTY